MRLTFVHDCLPQAEGSNGVFGCPVYDREVSVDSPNCGLNQYEVPDVRCLHTNAKLKLVAVDSNRNI